MSAKMEPFYGAIVYTNLLLILFILCHVRKCRMEKLWNEEVRRVGVKNALMSRVVIRFIWKRFIVATFAVLIYVGLDFFIIVSFSLFNCLSFVWVRKF